MEFPLCQSVLCADCATFLLSYEDKKKQRNYLYRLLTTDRQLKGLLLNLARQIGDGGW